MRKLQLQDNFGFGAADDEDNHHATKKALLHIQVRQPTGDIAMRGYFERLGQAFKLDFDTVSGQFVSKSITHAFSQNAEVNIVVKKLADLRERNQRDKAKRQLNKLLANMSPELRDDLGMTETFAATDQS